MHQMFRAIRRIVEEHPDVKMVYPVHLNPIVQGIASEELGGFDRVRLVPPMDVLDFHNILAPVIPGFLPIVVEFRKRLPVSESPCWS